MPGPVGDKGDKIGIGACIARAQSVQNTAQRFNQFKVRVFVFTTDVIATPQHALFQNQQKRVGVVLDIQPIANIAPIAINGQGFFRQRVQNHHRDQFFRKMIGAVVVRTIRQHHRQAIGFMPRADQMIRTCLGRGIGAARVIGRFLGKHARGAKRTEHLIRTDVVKAERIGAALGLPICARRL